jgi:hypothetical protein
VSKSKKEISSAEKILLAIKHDCWLLIYRIVFLRVHGLNPSTIDLSPTKIQANKNKTTLYIKPTPKGMRYTIEGKGNKKVTKFIPFGKISDLVKIIEETFPI